MEKGNFINYEDISEFITYDESSPTLLRLIKDKGNLKAGTVIGSLKPNNNGYLRCGFNRVSYLSHRLIYALYYGVNLSSDVIIDHIDRDTLNNKPSNLRPVTIQHNSWNTSLSKNNSSGVKGVIWHKAMNLWMVHWKVNRVSKTKSFRPEKLFPELPYENAKEMAFEIACRFRENINKEVFVIEEVKLGTKEGTTN